MRILLITDEVWNDRIHGNNVLSNWFDGFSAEFAQIYCSPGLPQNNCCDRYFQITDRMMLNSIFKNSKAGKIVKEKERLASEYESSDIDQISFLKKHCGHILRFFKNFVWTNGHYDEDTLQCFITDFKPDIIYSPRMATPKLLRLERIVKKFTNCPMIAFTGDNEYSLKVLSFSPIAWINKFWVRGQLRRNASLYSLYYTLSDEQKAEYEKVFSFPVKVLRKCVQSPVYEPDPLINTPIKLVYAGKLYCNRWKTLAEIGKAIQTINLESRRILLDIYTKDTLDNRMKKSLESGDSVVIHEPISAKEVLQKYKECDIALHIESFDLKSRYATRLSFSTKIIDCLGCGCAILAVAWIQHSGLTYLQREDAAICICDRKDLLPRLRRLVEHPALIADYKRKAFECAKTNHSKVIVQRNLKKDFEEIVGI